MTGGDGRRGIQRDRLANRQLGLDPGRLEHDADPVAELTAPPSGIGAEHGDLTAVARTVALEDLDDRRLAGAVVPEQGVHLSFAMSSDTPRTAS